MKKAVILWACILFAAITLGGCSMFKRWMAAKRLEKITCESARLDFSIPGVAKRTDIFDLSKDVARSLGFEVSPEPLKTYNLVMFRKTPLITANNFNTGMSVWELMLFRKSKDEKDLSISIRLWGAFGRGSQMEAEKLADEFKARLQNTLDQSPQ